MAITAAVAEFSLVLVLMAARAIDFYFSEWRPVMTAGTGNGSMVPCENVARQLVIKIYVLLQIMP